MRISLLIVCVFVSPFQLLLAQNLQVAIGGGFAGYQGDLQNNEFYVNSNDPALGVVVKYQLLPRIGLRAGYYSGKVSAHDKNNTASLRSRNLSFSTILHEVNLMVEYSFLKKSQSRISPYVMGGIALFRFNPFSFDPSGNKVYLRPLSTEGQGFPEYPNNQPYKLIQVSIPMGGGIRIRLNEFVDICFETGFRRLFTDYLDDVSGDYVDPLVLQQRKGTLALKMAFRSDELPNASATYPGKDYPRGNAKYKDWYSFHTTSLNIHLTDLLDQLQVTKKTQCPRF